MRSATVRLTITMNCPLGNLSANQSYLLAPPDWPNTIVKQWTVAGQALCFSCVDGEVVGPPYTLTVSATVQGEGTDYRLYNSGGPVSVNFPMRQFPPHTPC